MDIKENIAMYTQEMELWINVETGSMIAKAVNRRLRSSAGVAPVDK
jgi:hypothetical protein